MKLGRNEACHCGSGKKYKRCCLDKVSEKNNNDRTAPTDQSGSFHDACGDKGFKDEAELWDNESSEEEYSAESRDTDHDGNSTEEDFRTEHFSKLYSCKKFVEYIPEISQEEQSIVDEWWTRFKTVYFKKGIDPIRCLELIKDFCHKNQKLVPNLYLHEEALFEIQSAFLQTDQYSVFIDFLKWFRNHFFDTYSICGMFYDTYLVEYYLVHGPEEEIHQYFSLFHEYPDRDPDQVMRLVELFKATNHSELLVSLLRNIYLHLYYSANVFGGSAFVIPIMQDTYFKYCKKDYSAQDIDSLCEDTKALSEKVPSLGIIVDRAFWENHFQDIFSKGFSHQFPSTKNGVKDYYRKVYKHFTGYLHENKNMQWITADYYASLVCDYLKRPLTDGKIIKRPFQFSKNNLDHYIARTFQEIIGIKSIPSMAFLEALWYFAEYLEQEKLFTLEEKFNLKKSCQELFKTVYALGKKNRYATCLFNNLASSKIEDTP